MQTQHRLLGHIAFCIFLQGLLLKLETFNKTVLERFSREVLLDYLDDIYEDHDLLYKINVYKLLWGYDDPILRLLKRVGLTDNSTFYLEVSTIISHCVLPLVPTSCISKTTVEMIVKVGVQLEQVRRSACNYTRVNVDYLLAIIILYYTGCYGNQFNVNIDCGLPCLPVWSSHIVYCFLCIEMASFLT